MLPGRRWNQMLVGLLVVMFLLNIWLIRTVNWMGSIPCFSKSLNIQIKDTTQYDKNIIWPVEMATRFNGRHSIQSASLTVGIPTVHREKGFYILETLQSIIENTSDDDKKITIIVVFTADFNTTYNKKVSQAIGQRFQTYVDSGLIRMVQAPRHYYPSFQHLKHNFGDSMQRIIWRSKQVMDYAFLYQFCHSLTDYYLQLEDDVKTSPRFVKSIQEYISLNKHENWTTLEFSELGFIGKLFHSFDLLRFKEFILLFYEDQPIDYLLKYFNLLNGQKKSFLRVPSLFQHIGSYSSLTDKKQSLKDRFFEENIRQHSADNPPADVYSSISTFSMYAPYLSYTNSPGYFWGHSPKIGDVIIVIFHETVRLKRVVFETGSPTHPLDILHNAVLTAGRQVFKKSDNSTPLCQDEIDLGVFSGGRIDVDTIEYRIKSHVACLKVLVTGSQSHWVLLREIGVWKLN